MKVWRVVDSGRDLVTYQIERGGGVDVVLDENLPAIRALLAALDAEAGEPVVDWRDLNLDCSACWTSVCSAHGDVPVRVKARALVGNYTALANLYEAARGLLGHTLGHPDADLAVLVAEATERIQATKR